MIREAISHAHHKLYKYFTKFRKFRVRLPVHQGVQLGAGVERKEVDVEKEDWIEDERSFALQFWTAE